MPAPRVFPVVVKKGSKACAASPLAMPRPVCDKRRRSKDHCLSDRNAHRVVRLWSTVVGINASVKCPAGRHRLTCVLDEMPDDLGKSSRIPASTGGRSDTHSTRRSIAGPSRRPALGGQLPDERSELENLGRQ